MNIIGVPVPIDHILPSDFFKILKYYISMDKIDFEKYITEMPKPNMESTTSTVEDFNTEDIWKIVSENLKMVLDRVEYNSWFSDTYLEDIRNGVATLSCSSEFKRGTILRDYSKFLQSCLTRATGQNLQLEILIKSSGIKRKDTQDRYEFVSTPQQSSVTLFSGIESDSKKYKQALSSARLNPKYTFDNFIVGPNSRLAEAVAQAVVHDINNNNLTKSYNPVFYYGSTGVGKTHLMQAIGNEVIKKDPEKKVVYVSIEQFLNEMIEAIRTRKNEDFRSKYREVDLLIIDDIQFVEDYPKTQEELFHTFNTLYQANKQIILASDRPPREIKNITDRLRSRFEGGMVADIQIPDYETRVAILKQSLLDKNATVPDMYLELIAKNIENSVRELEGALNKVITLSKLGEVPTYEEVARILQLDIESKRNKVTPLKVLDVTSSVFDISVRYIKSKRRMAHISLARQVVMYILRTDLELPLETVAKEVNRTDHTTVLHACKQIEQKMKQDSRLAEKVELCRKKIFF